MGFKKMSDEKITELFKSLMPADIIFVEADNIVGWLISFGTANDDTFKPCHAMQYIGDGTGKTIEADGKAINYHVIEEYRNSLKKGEQRLVVYRLKDLTVEELDLIKKAWKEDLGKSYNWAVIGLFSVWGVLRKVPLLGGLIGMLPNVAYNSNSMVCSQQVAQSLRYIDRYYKVITADKPVSNMTPEELSERIIRIADFKVDTKL